MCSPRNSESRGSQEMESFYLTIGRRVMDLRGVEGGRWEEGKGLTYRKIATKRIRIQVKEKTEDIGRL